MGRLKADRALTNRSRARPKRADLVLTARPGGLHRLSYARSSARPDKRAIRAHSPFELLQEQDTKPCSFVSIRDHKNVHARTSFLTLKTKIVLPAQTEVLGPEVDRLPTLHTNARTDTPPARICGGPRLRTCKPPSRPCSRRPMARP
jgi:hypothetical protein